MARGNCCARVVCGLALGLALAPAASASHFVCPFGPFGGPFPLGGLDCESETPAPVPLDPPCFSGGATTYTDFLQVPNNALVIGAQLLDPNNGKPYASPDNPICGPGSTLAFTGVSDWATPPGNPPPDAPDRHWVGYSYVIDHVPSTFNNTAPLYQPQFSFQVPACTATAGGPIPTVRLEGITELVGELLLQCTGGQPTPSGKVIPTTNLSLTLNAPVTSRLLNGAFSGALLLLDDPFPASNQVPCIPPTPGAACPAVAGASPSPNVFQGIVHNNSVTWNGVPLVAPSSNAPSVVRITNILASPPATGGPIQGSVTFSNPLLGAPTGSTTLAQTQRGLSSLLGPGSGPTTIPRCTTVRGNQQSGVLHFSELFPTAFKTRANSTTPANAGNAPAPQDTPSQSVIGETGFFNPAFGTIPGQGDLGQAGLADWGDRVQATFDHVPAGMRLLVPLQLHGPNGAVAIRVANPLGPFVAFKPMAGLPRGEGQVPLTRGAGTVTYEVVGLNPAAVTSFQLPILASVGRGLGTGVANLSAALGPLSKVNSASATAPIPRFSASSLSGAPLLSVTPCSFLGSLGLPASGATIIFPTGSPTISVPVVNTGPKPFDVELVANFGIRFASDATAARTIARGSRVLPAHSTRAIALRLTALGRRLLAGNASQRVRLAVTIRARGRTTRTSTVIKLKALGAH